MMNNMNSVNTNSLNGIKQQLMTLLMFQSTTNKESSSSSIWMMMYSFVVITIIERLSSAIPVFFQWVNGIVNKKINSAMIENIPTLLTEGGGNKLASITIHIQLNKPDPLGFALLDLITNSTNTKSIHFIKGTFSLNEKVPILIHEENEIYSQLIKTEVSLTEDSNADSASKQVIEIYSTKIKIDVLRKYLEDITRIYSIKVQNKLGDKLFYFNCISVPAFVNPDNTKDYSRSPPTFTFTMKQFQTNRKFKNVIGDESTLIKKRVEFFLKNEKWYNDKGVPYTLGLLLSGCPGSGKTSTIKCVANETKRHIINVHFNDNITISQMENLFFSETINVNSFGKTEQYIIPFDKRIYVFEDIDCQHDIVYDRDLKEKEEGKKEKEDKAHNTRNDFQPNQSPSQLFNVKTHPGKEIPITNAGGNGSEKLTLSSLLNLLDGVLETPGRIIIMTSNFPQKLDKALTRPGRIDLMCEFKKCSNKMICQFFEMFYSMTLSDDEKQKINRLPEETWSPAELTKILFEYYDNYEGALSILYKKLLPKLTESIGYLTDSIGYFDDDDSMNQSLILEVD
jgi:hypothetical protein